MLAFFGLLVHFKKMKLSLHFIGATGTVTGSKFLIQVGEQNHLIDCGLFQGFKLLRVRNWEPLPMNPQKIDSVILTHAHVDHSGYIPLLVKEGFHGPIYATPATQALCNILLPDAGYLQEEDAAYANKHMFSKHTPALPLFTEEDAKASLKYFKPVSWNKKVTLSKEASFEFLEAGHIIGASVVRMNCYGRLVTFSSDLGRQNSLTMNLPADIGKTDYLVLESTYGNRLHPPQDPYDELKGIIIRTVRRGGVILIPAFAVGRTEKLLLLISRLKKHGDIPNIPVYVNSPMAMKATEAFCRFLDEHAISKEECDDLMHVAKFISTTEESKALSSAKDPAIIISASGMAAGGRVLHHLKTLAPDPKNTILFVGFQAAGTRGEAMIHGHREIKIHGEIIPVKAEVRLIETLSAHADQNEIIDWLKAFEKPPKVTFLTHGEPEACLALKQRIEDELHWRCEVPEYLQKYNLD